MANSSKRLEALSSQFFEEWDQRADKVQSSCQAGDILFQARQAINDRASERDVEAERSMKRAVAIFNAYSGRDLTETDGWMFMLCLKMARSKSGAFQKDDYIDMCGYAALAGECDAKKRRTG
jgi:hypothetical protein